MTKWLGPVPETDDFGVKIKNVFIDGKTVFGPWAIMAPSSHRSKGCGLGSGKGQRYELGENGDWNKTKG